MLEPPLAHAEKPEQTMARTPAIHPKSGVELSSSLKSGQRGSSPASPGRDALEGGRRCPAWALGWEATAAVEVDLAAAALDLAAQELQSAAKDLSPPWALTTP